MAVFESEYLGFPGRDWKSATPDHLASAVNDVKTLFSDGASSLFRNLQREIREFLSPLNSDDRLLLLPKLFQEKYQQLEDALVRYSGDFFVSFLKIAINHQLNPDPVRWAHAQTHAVIRDFLDPVKGHKRVITVREWIKDCCSGSWRPSDEDLESPDAMERSLLREDWSAPPWLQRLVGGGRSQLHGDKLLEVLASQFWRGVQQKLADEARLARVSLAETGSLPVRTGNVNQAIGDVSGSDAAFAVAPARKKTLDGPKLGSKKTDMTRYMDQAKLTQRQRECFSLVYEYGLPKAEIARRLGIHHSTLDEHLAAANKRIDSSLSKERSKRNHAKAKPGGFLPRTPRF